MEENSDNIDPTLIKVFCVICREYAKTTEKMFSSSKCGHVFHGDCIVKSLEDDYLCPECHSIVNKYVIHRLFLNVYEDEMKHEMEVLAMEPLKTLYWIQLEEPATAEELEEIGFKLGVDEEGDPIYAARAYYWGERVPGYYIPKLKGIRFGWNKDTCFVTESVELLRVDEDDADYEWVAASNGDIPKHSLTAGYSDFGVPLYFARQFYEDKLRFGKLHPPIGAYLVVDETEALVKNYEVLTRVSRRKKAEQVK